MEIVAFAPNSWFGPWMNRQQILSRLGRRHGVVYSQGLARASWLFGSKRSERRVSLLGSLVATDNVLVHVPGVLLMETRGWGPLKERVVRVGLGSMLRKARRVWGRAGDPLVFYSFAPGFVRYLEYLAPAVTVYHAYDCYAKQAGWTEETARLHRQMIERADVVIASSEPIGRWLRETGADTVHVVPNGVDFERFRRPAGWSEAQVPWDLARVPRPRIGYFGNITRKVDLGLVDELAGRRPDWSFVFVGGLRNLDEEVKSALERCKSRRNVFFLGHKPHPEVPRYVWGMDVAIAAYRMRADLWAEYVYPLKLHEYLAAGVPVVTSPVEAVSPFVHVLAVADGADEWEAAIEHALRDGGVGTPEERMQVASQNTWDARVEHIENLIKDHIICM